MAISQMYSRNAESSPQNSHSKEKQVKTTAAFKKKLLNKKSTSANYKTIKKEEHIDLEKPLICYKRSPKIEESSALDRANEVQESLPSTFPSLVKPMVRSHVSSCFWLGLPKKFCDKHMPKKDVTVFMLEDEMGNEYGTSYLWERTGLSGGWRGFAMKHNLVEGDVLVFQLIEPCRFKVYICRRNGNGSAEIDSSIAGKPLPVDVQPKPLAVEEEDEIEKNGEMDASENTSDDSPAVFDEFGESEELGNEVFHGITFSDKVVDFKDVKTLEDFEIIVDGLVIDSEIPARIRSKYYHLCTSQRDYLHNHLIEGLNCNLAAGVIIGAVDASDAIRAAKLTTPLEELRKWDKSLKLCEDMGMELGFLRTRLDNMFVLHSEQTRMIQMKISERARVEEKMKRDEAELVKLEGTINVAEAELKVLKVESAGPELAILQAANAPW